MATRKAGTILTVTRGKLYRVRVKPFAMQTVQGSREDAERVRDELVAKRKATSPADRQARRFDVTLSQYADDWIATKLATREIAPRTSVLYRGVLVRHVYPHLGEARLDRITSAQLRKLIAALAKVPTTQRKVVTLLRTLFEQARVDRIVDRKATDGLGTPKLPRRRPKSLTREQLTTLLDAMNGHRYEALVLFIAHTGCRGQEAGGLRWRDLALDSGQVTIGAQVLSEDEEGRAIFKAEGKSANSLRTIRLSDPIVAMLRQHKAERTVVPISGGDDALVFTGPGGRPLNLRNLRKALLVPARRAGLPHGFSPHWLRHTLISLLLYQGVPARVVADRVGDAVATILSAYSDSLPATDDHAVRLAGELVAKG